MIYFLWILGLGYSAELNQIFGCEYPIDAKEFLDKPISKNIEDEIGSKMVQFFFVAPSDKFLNWISRVNTRD